MSDGQATVSDGPALPSMDGPIDSHCHLQSLKPAERQEALRQARERGVRGFLVPAITLDDTDDLLELCHSNDDVWCALGVHPHNAKAWRRGDAERLSDLVSDPKVVAVGECGLDFYYDHAPREVQVRAMREQWEVAQDQRLPVVIHNRDSNEDMLATFTLPAHAGLRADFHSFAGGLDMAEALMEHGCYFGMSGMITFPRADNVREVLPVVPKDRLLVETDTPYLAPVPYRGKPNRPGYVVEVAQRLAQELEEEVEATWQRTGEAFYRCFPKAIAP